jgi:hypothetical protein
VWYPDFLHSVKEIDIRVFSLGNHRRGEEVLNVYARLLSQLKHATPLSERLILKDDDDFIRREDAFRALLFLACEDSEIYRYLRNFRRPLMDLVINELCGAHLAARRDERPSPGPFANITTIECSRSDSDESDVGNVLQWLALPRLESLKVPCLHGLGLGGRGYLPKLESLIRNRNPIDIRFDSCSMSGEGLSHILAACAGPISATLRWHLEMKSKDIRYDIVADALREHGARLDHVLLDPTICWRGDAVLPQ